MVVHALLVLTALYGATRMLVRLGAVCFSAYAGTSSCTELDCAAMPGVVSNAETREVLREVAPSLHLRFCHAMSADQVVRLRRNAKLGASQHYYYYNPPYNLYAMDGFIVSAFAIRCQVLDVRWLVSSAVLGELTRTPPSLRMVRLY
eukprot:3662594-Rhodomonas_salina.4